MAKFLLAKFLFIFVFLVGGGFGVWKLTEGTKALASAWQSASWPSVTGQIADARIDFQGRRHPIISPVVKYVYVVNATTYHGSEVMPGRFWSNSSAHEIMVHFHTGGGVPVYYSATDPSRSLLVPGLHVVNFATFLIGLFTFTFMLPFGLAGIFGVRDGADSLTYPERSPLGTIAAFCILATFVGFFVLLVLSWIS